jgi:hypothetical protein
VDRTVFAKRDHFFGKRADRFRFCQRGFDPLMLDQIANLIGEQRFTMLGFAAEPHRLFLMSHRFA